MATDFLGETVVAERGVSARRIAPIRLVAVAFFWSLFFVLGVLLKDPQWQSNFALWTAYLVAAISVFVFGRKLEPFARFAGFAIALFDMPVVYLVQRSTFPHSTSAGAVAGYTIGVFAVMIAVAVLSLDLRQIVASFVIGSALGIALQYEAGITVGAMISTPMVLGLGAVSGYFLYRRLIEMANRVVQDTLDKKELEDHLVHTDRLATLGVMTASVAHEVGNPLTYLLGNLELLLMKAEDGKLKPEDTVNGISEALKGGERIAKIVSDMKRLSRRDRESLRAVDLKAVAETVIGLAKAELQKQAQLDVRLDPIPMVIGTEVRLSQVILNLLVNAGQAIRGDPYKNHIILKTSTGPNGEAVVTVADTGTGMTPDVKDQLFQPFFTTKKTSGTGLGLSICAELVRTHGGRIEVDSVIGEGSTFRVLLPARGQPPLEFKVPKSGSWPPTQGPVIPSR